MFVSLFYEGALYSRALTCFFAAGKSVFKLYLFLAWAVFFFLLLMFPPRNQKKISFAWLYGLILTLCVASVASHIFFVFRYGLSFSASTAVVVNNIFSFNSYLHNHLLKGILGAFVDKLGWTSLSYIADPGIPFSKLLPHALFFLLLPLIATVFVLILRAGLQKERELLPPLKFPFVCVYVVSSFVVLKSFFDGGPLSYDFIVFFTALHSVLRSRGEDFKCVLAYFLKHFLAAFACVALLSACISFRDLAYFLFNTARALSALFFITMIALGVSASSKVTRFGILLFLLAASFYLWGLSNSFWFYEWRYLSRKLVPGDKIFIMETGKEELPYRLLFQEGSTRIYTHDIQSPATFLDFFRKHRIPFSYSHILLSGYDCIENVSVPRQGKIRIVEAAPLNVGQNSEMMESFSLTPCVDLRKCDYFYKAMIKGCVSIDSDWVIINHLTQIGFKKFILQSDKKGDVVQIP